MESCALRSDAESYGFEKAGRENLNVDMIEFIYGDETHLTSRANCGIWVRRNNVNGKTPLVLTEWAPAHALIVDRIPVPVGVLERRCGGNEAEPVDELPVERQKSRDHGIGRG
jgi:hypothetical protein